MKEIELTQGKSAIVDDEDYERVTAFKWHAVRCKRAWYAARSIKGRSFGMHRFLMGSPPSEGLVIDHINGNGLDNRRCNLRWVTAAQNQANKIGFGTGSRFKGVARRSRSNRVRWEAVIKTKGVQRHLGYFDREEDAARAYDSAAVETFGVYARLNFQMDRSPA
jgi:hypothetical protein